MSEIEVIQLMSTASLFRRIRWILDMAMTSLANCAGTVAFSVSRLVFLMMVSVHGQNANDGFDPSADGFVYGIAVQSDGKGIIGGGFTTVGGTAHSPIARLNVDGSLDLSFNAGADLVVYGLAIQTDGKILVCGGVTILGGQARSRSGRLNADSTPFRYSLLRCFSRAQVAETPRIHPYARRKCSTPVLASESPGATKNYVTGGWRLFAGSMDCFRHTHHEAGLADQIVI